ncbi:MAG: single-stranded DNA-binding protein [Firmicutes bacterium HGW-Firmicutes-2]|jgi:single-strand DNA-binding protein|nr:MAG: single-stranded DNA-binding protein [Firmicutes bacterium HGW-Firmicutes-2]
MNKVILMGRLTRDPEVRYTQGAEPLAIARYSLAVNKRFKKEGQPDADFINIVAFGREGEFAEKYFKKGQMVSVVGRLQTGSYTDKDGVKKYTTDVVVEEQHFAESKRSYDEQAAAGGSPEGSSVKAPTNNQSEGFVAIDNFDDDDLPF